MGLVHPPLRRRHRSEEVEEEKELREWVSLSEQLLEKALLLGLAVLGPLRSGALLGSRSSDGALV